MFCMFNEVEDKLLQSSRKQVIHETLINQNKKLSEPKNRPNSTGKIREIYPTLSLVFCPQPTSSRMLIFPLLIDIIITHFMPAMTGIYIIGQCQLYYYKNTSVWWRGGSQWITVGGCGLRTKTTQIQGSRHTYILYINIYRQSASLRSEPGQEIQPLVQNCQPPRAGG